MPGASIADIFQQGGPIMWPLLLLSVVSLTLAIERALFWSRALSRREAERWGTISDHVRRGRWRDAAKASASDRTIFGIFARRLIERARDGEAGPELMLTEGDARELIESVRSPLERFGSILSTIITAAPMLGILGTVVGIIQSFGLVGSAETVADPAVVAGGIAQALYTTAFGLIVALLTLFPYAIFRSLADRAFSRLETLASIAVERSSQEHRRQDRIHAPEATEPATA